jgi:hypothetical protein
MPKDRHYLVDDYFLDKLTNLKPEEIVKYKKLHAVDIDKYKALLKAAYELLKAANDCVFVKNILEEKVTYNGYEGDGFSLGNDIADLLKLEKLDG